MPIKDYSTTAANNTLTPPNGAPEGMAAGLVNNTIRQIMADTRSFYEGGGWCDLGHVPTYVSATSFTIPTDVTAYYTVGRRIRCYGTIMGTFYGYIVSSAYSSPNTTVTVVLDSGALTSNLSRVDLSFFEQLATVISSAMQPVASASSIDAARSVMGIVGRNKIINGDLRIWQRGTSGTPALNTTAYTADRVFTYATGASPTVSRNLLGSTGNPTTCAYALYAVGTAGNTAFQIGQKIESLNCLDMIAGRIYTFSAWINCTTAVTPTWQVYNADATDNWSSNTLVSSGTFSAVSANTWTRVTGSFTSTNGCLNGIQITFDVGTLTAGKNVYITGIQLESGSVATPFEHRIFGQELAYAQRYYEKSYDYPEALGTVQEVSSHWGIVNATDTTLILGPAYFKVPKLFSPTIVIYNTATGATGSLVQGVTTVNVSSASASRNGIFRVYMASAGTANTYARYHWTATSEL
jgi:hypothetical protein